MEQQQNNGLLWLTFWIEAYEKGQQSAKAGCWLATGKTTYNFELRTPRGKNKLQKTIAVEQRKNLIANFALQACNRNSNLQKVTAN